MKKPHIRQTGGPSGSVAHQLEMIVFCISLIAKEETKPRNMDRVHAVRAAMLAAFAAANLLGLHLNGKERRR